MVGISRLEVRRSRFGRRLDDVLGRASLRFEPRQFLGPLGREIFVRGRGQHMPFRLQAMYLEVERFRLITCPWACCRAPPIPRVARRPCRALRPQPRILLHGRRLLRRPQKSRNRRYAMLLRREVAVIDRQ